MTSKLDALKETCSHWETELEKMRGELLRAEQLFSSALQDQRDRIAFAEEQLRLNMEAIAHFGETRPLAEIMCSLAKSTPEAPLASPADALQTIIDGDGSRSAKARRITTYILERSTKPLRNREIVDEYDKIGFKIAPSPEELRKHEPEKYPDIASAHRRSFSLKWDLIRKAFDKRVVKKDDDTYWLKDHPLDPASS